MRGDRFEPVCLIVCDGEVNHYFRLAPGTHDPLPMGVYPHLPRLKISGAFVLRSDTSDRIIFKGLSLFHRKTAKPRGNEVLALVRTNVEANERLGILSNLVRLSYFSHEVSDEDLAGFEEAAGYLSAKGIYLALTPHNVQIDSKGRYIPIPSWQRPPTGNYFLPDAMDARILGALARRLREFSHVIYGIWNEPANTTWDAFEGTLKAMSDGVLVNFPKGVPPPLLLVPGMNWSRDFRGAKIPLPKDSYLVDVHEYPSLGGGIRHMYAPMILRVPMLFSEMGGAVSRDYHPQTQEDIARIRDILFEMVDAPEFRGAMHYCIWKGDDSPDGVRGADGELSARGRLVLEEKRRFPTHYDFLNGR